MIDFPMRSWRATVKTMAVSPVFSRVQKELKESNANLFTGEKMKHVLVYSGLVSNNNNYTFSKEKNLIST